MKIAVVGAGIMGSCTALELTDRGHQVTVIEQFDPGHTRGSSHGNSRIIRKAYPEAFFTKIMVEAYGLWRSLEKRIGKPIVHECGLLYFGDKASPTVQSLTSALRENGVEQTEVEGQAVAQFNPLLRLEADEVGYWTREAGWVEAKVAVSGTLQAALSNGAHLKQQRVDDPKSLLGEFDRVILCQGSWSKQALALPVRVTMQTFGYLQTPEPVGGSVWIDDHEFNIYGFPSEAGRSSIKFGVHSIGPEINPDLVDRPNDGESLDILRAFARYRFDIPDPVLESVTTCLYTRTSTEDFLWGESSPGVLFVSACSGHGFKFGPWVGKQMALAVEDLSVLKAYDRFWVS